jgi:hypothetical protein
MSTRTVSTRAPHLLRFVGATLATGALAVALMRFVLPSAL